MFFCLKYMLIENIYAVWKNIYQSEVYLTFPKIYSDWKIFLAIE